MSTVSPATETVLATPELLEQLLAFLSMRDLLLIAPLVSKTWQAITFTPRLQRILFFQADPASTSAEPVQNPLLVEIFSPFFIRDLETQSRWSWPDAKTIIALPWASAPAAFRRPDASWRRMLVQQPPLRHLPVTEIRHGRMGDWKRRAKMVDVELRMGTLYDLVLPLIDRPASSFRIRWNGTADEDVALDAIFTTQCCRGVPPPLDKQFYTQGTYEWSKRIKLDFGEWAP